MRNIKDWDQSAISLMGDPCDEQGKYGSEVVNKNRLSKPVLF